ncbi:hypothetical protein B0H13DRAFT_1936601 [Mycena leptocephala]|nr:hypothetical protein B0H13DRAFT_1936601 [Mycena leptocephala]
MPRNCKPKLTVLVQKKLELICKSKLLLLVKLKFGRQMIRHLSADDLPLIRRRSAAHLQRVCSSGANGCDLPDSTGHPQIPFMDAKITRGNLAKFEVGTFEDDL